MHSERFLATNLARAQPVQTHTRDSRGQPATEVADVSRTCSAEPEPGVLHGVISVCERTQHSVRHGPEMGPMLLESFRQPLVVVHLSGPSAEKRLWTRPPERESPARTSQPTSMRDSPCQGNADNDWAAERSCQRNDRQALGAGSRGSHSVPRSA